MDEMQTHPLYAKYPAQGVENLGAMEGYFDNLDMFCACAYDRKAGTPALSTDESDNGLFIWSKVSMEGTRKKGGDLELVQLGCSCLPVGIHVPPSPL